MTLANDDLVDNPSAGGHLMVMLQYLLGLRALGHEVLWLEIHDRQDEPLEHATSRGMRLLGRFASYGIDDGVAIGLIDGPLTPESLDRADILGMDRDRLGSWLSDCDVLWNMTGTLPKDLLGRFRRTVFIDLDPGIIQVAALTWDSGLEHHDARLTLGRRIGAHPDLTPDLGLTWRSFHPITHLPMWSVQARPPLDAPFTSVTHWWGKGELEFRGRLLSRRKRDAYLRYVRLPSETRRRFQLAVGTKDVATDLDVLLSHGWEVVDALGVAATPRSYQDYIARSLAEFSCPKPAFRELETGWISDRTVAYLASGRPVLAEDTGFSRDVPTGQGLVAFTSMEDALEGVRLIERDWERQALAARRLAEEAFDARYWLPRMIEASFSDT